MSGPGSRRAARRDPPAVATPAGRRRSVDLLRAGSITVVVLGHWLAVTLEVHDGRLTGRSILAALPWTQALTWPVQVMPVFFLVGGFANAASLRSAGRRGVPASTWLRTRLDRLLRPAVLLVAGVGVLAGTVTMAGADPDLVRDGLWLAGIGLWFLVVYVGVVLLAPPTLALHHRWGWRVPTALGVLAALADGGRLGLGVPELGLPNYLLVWLAVHQLGYGWHDGTLTRAPVPAALALGGVAGLVLLVGPGPYPVSMVSVPGAAVQNTAPPTVALLALALAQTGAVLLLDAPLSRWCRRERVWRAVALVNARVLSVFLWHMVPVAVAGPVLYLSGLFPQPPVGGAAWWLLRVPWVVVLAVLLVVVVVPVSRVETSRRGSASGRDVTR